MRTLIIYATKTGTTKRCAALLTARLGAENADMVDISLGTPELEGYDTIVLGSPVRMGKIDGRIRSYIDGNMALLLKKRLGVYTCNCFLERAADAFSNNFSENIMEHAICMDTFGGELDPKKQRGADRIIAAMAIKAGETDENLRVQRSILPENMKNFVAELLADCGAEEYAT